MPEVTGGGHQAGVAHLAVIHAAVGVGSEGDVVNHRAVHGRIIHGVESRVGGKGEADLHAGANVAGQVYRNGLPGFMHAAPGRHGRGFAVFAAKGVGTCEIVAGGDQGGGDHAPGDSVIVGNADVEGIPAVEGVNASGLFHVQTHLEGEGGAAGGDGAGGGVQDQVLVVVITADPGAGGEGGITHPPAVALGVAVVVNMPHVRRNRAVKVGPAGSAGFEILSIEDGAVRVFGRAGRVLLGPGYGRGRNQSRDDCDHRQQKYEFFHNFLQN